MGKQAVKENQLEELASQYKVPSHAFRKACEDADDLRGISALDLIKQGAKTMGLAGYLKLKGDIYEPVQFANAGWLEDGCIGSEGQVPVAYRERGKPVPQKDHL